MQGPWPPRKLWVRDVCRPRLIVSQCGARNHASSFVSLEDCNLSPWSCAMDGGRHQIFLAWTEEKGRDALKNTQQTHIEAPPVAILWTKKGPQRLSAAPNSGGGLNNLPFSPLRPLLSSPPSSLSPLSSLGPSQLAWATTAQPTWGPVLAHLKRVRNFFPTASGPAAHPRRVNLTLARGQHALTQKK